MPAIGQPRKTKAQNLRPDPEPAHLDGVAGAIALENADATKKYVWVSRNRQTLNDYRRMGYRPEAVREGGVSMAGEDFSADQQGKEVEFDGHVLMSVTQERAQQIEINGPYGKSGQKLVDAVEKQIVTKRGGEDHFRGLGVERRRGQNPYFMLENDTTPLAPDGEG